MLGNTKGENKMRIQFTFYSDYFKIKPVMEIFRIAPYIVYEFYWLWFHCEFVRTELEALKDKDICQNCAEMEYSGTPKGKTK